MWVESELEAGSTFHFTVCMQKSSDAVLKLPPGRTNLEDMAVLIVDDNPTILKCWNSFLPPGGCGPQR
jgi:hypothetical protein